MEDTYVDDIQGGGGKEEDTTTFKEESIKILSGGGFSLHKWHSNVEHLNLGDQACEEETYTKSLVGNKGRSETKILGTQWDNKGDTLTVQNMPERSEATNKKEDDIGNKQHL